MKFADRRDAGRRLAQRLLPLAAEDPVVVALPRGGVPVAREVAAALGAPLDVLAVRKLGAPADPEYAIGAIAEDGTRVIDPEIVTAMGVSAEEVDAIVSREVAELDRRVAAYREGRAPIGLRGRTAIVVDDGVATGLTDMAALRAVRRRGPRRLILAVPVCAPESARRLRRHADRVICLLAPARLRGVGDWYAATKGGLILLSQSLRAEYRGSAVGFSVVCPGFVGGDGMYQRMADEGVRSNLLIGETTIERVCDKLVDAVRRDRPEVVESGTPIRPLLAASQLSPRFGGWIAERIGANELYRRTAAKRGRVAKA